MSLRGRRRKMMSEINVVPYIDVMLVLLIIFMITAPLLKEGVKVDLPAADAKPIDAHELQRHEPLIVTVDAGGRMYVNIGSGADRPLPDDVLKARTAAVLRRDPRTPVLVKADRSVPYGAVVRAMVLLQNAGADKVGLLTDPAAAGAGSAHSRRHSASPGQ